MTPITVALPDDTVADLERIALEQRRRPKDQAAVMLIEAIAKSRQSSSTINRAIREQIGRGPKP